MPLKIDIQTITLNSFVFVFLIWLALSYINVGWAKSLEKMLGNSGEILIQKKPQQNPEIFYIS